MVGRINRLLAKALLLALSLPWLVSTTNAAYVVASWTSPTYGFSIEYRADAFSLGSETTDGSIDTLELISDAGTFTVEGMPVLMTPDACVQAVFDEVLASNGIHEIVQPITNGVGQMRTVLVDSAGVLQDYVRRIDCVNAPDGRYQVRFVHFATTGEHGLYEIAARDIRASLEMPSSGATPEPGDSAIPPGTVEVTFIPLATIFTSPEDLDPFYQPVRLLTVEIVLVNISQAEAVSDARRVVIDDLGSPVSSVWTLNGVVVTGDVVTIPAGGGAVGHFTYAVPASQTDVTFCYRHATDGSCALIANWEIDGAFPVGPNSRPRINMGG